MRFFPSDFSFLVIGAVTGGGSSLSAVVDIFHATSSQWSTAILSVGRGYLAATSFPDFGIAIFAGGGDGGGSSTLLDLSLQCVCVCKVYSHYVCVLISNLSDVFSTVDIFNATSARWTTAALSIPRKLLAATSLPNYRIAMFAGGRSTSCFVSTAPACHVFSRLHMIVSTLRRFR